MFYSLRQRQRRSAFTLVELLVVIGIIALLLSILMPVLSHAREAGQRTKCLANLRSIHQILTMYANEYQDKTLLGHNATPEDFRYNYVIARGAPAGKRYMLLGLLVAPDMKLREENPGVLFCPSSTQTSVSFGFNTELNIWPPEAISGYTRAGYGVRPAEFETGNPWTWRNRSYPVNGDVASAPINWPKLSQMKNLAIATDLTLPQPEVDFPLDTTRLCHKGGINVLYGNGSVRWVAQAEVTRRLERQLMTIDRTDIATANPLVMQLWLHWDKQ